MLDKLEHKPMVYCKRVMGEDVFYLRVGRKPTIIGRDFAMTLILSGSVLQTEQTEDA